MTFKSKESKELAVGSVNKLLATYLPSASTIIHNGDDSSPEGQYIDAISGGSGAARIANIRKEANKIRKNAPQQRKLKKKLQRKRRSAIRANEKTEKRVEKLSRLAIGDETEVNKAIEKNLSNLKGLRPANRDELAKLQREILDLRNKAPESAASAAKKEHVGVPGLTPGLAPVDMTDSDDEEAELPAGFKDDYDEWN